jgi:hypothetical protein
MDIANRDASGYVTRREEFTGSNLFGIWENGIYVVYSYGLHWPLWVHDGARWLENTDTYSRATSRHKNQSRPSEDTLKRNTEQLLSLIKDRASVNDKLWR